MRVTRIAAVSLPSLHCVRAGVLPAVLRGHAQGRDHAHHADGRFPVARVHGASAEGQGARHSERRVCLCGVIRFGLVRCDWLRRVYLCVARCWTWWVWGDTPLCGMPDASKLMLEGKIDHFPAYEDHLSLGW